MRNAEPDLREQRIRHLKNRIIRVATLLAALSLLAAVPPICGCGGDKQTTMPGSQPSTDPQETVPTPDSAEPRNWSGTSPSKVLLERAKAEGKPVLLKFGSGMCLPCIEIDENINRIRPEYEGKVAFIIVDLNDRSEYPFAMEYRVETIPTTIFFRKDGSIANGYVGVLTQEELRNELNSLL